MPGYSTILGLHLAAGVVALVTFWLNGAMRKGGALHRRIGQAYLCAMLAIMLSGVPLVAQRILDGRAVAAAFLAYLLVLTGTASWSMWRAVRDRAAPARYTGRMYRALALLNMLSGAGVLALGAAKGSPLLIGFSIVGLFAGRSMWRQRDTLTRAPMWWRTEHYNAVLANGVATHIAFLSIGLPKLLPGVAVGVLSYAAWFGPLLVAGLAKLWLDRRYRPRPVVGAPGPVPGASRSA